MATYRMEDSIKRAHDLPEDFLLKRFRTEVQIVSDLMGYPPKRVLAPKVVDACLELIAQMVGPEKASTFKQALLGLT